MIRSLLSVPEGIMKRLIVAALVGVAFSNLSFAQPIVGISLSDVVTPRWPRERDAMVALLKDAGCEVLANEANHNAGFQADQIKAMVLKGAKILIVVAEDGERLVPLVDELAAQGIEVIACDRLIPTASLAAYVSFDLVEIGRLQARGVIEAMKPFRHGSIVLLGGSPTNVPEAHLFRKGQMEVLQPLIDAGRLRVVADMWVANWDPANAMTLMKRIIQETKGRFDAVVASNDGTALGALRALKASGLAGKVPISGQDATEGGCSSIARGELTVTVLKDDRRLSTAVCDIALKLARGEAIPDLVSFRLSNLMLDDSLAGDVPCSFLPLALVTKDNLKSLVVDSGYQDYDAVYAGVENPPPR
jgi:D-xylose transport system substrate-binding protein